MLDVAVIGGGLCGLSVARRLQAAGVSFLLFEARMRLGGRILTEADAPDGLAVDLGPGWFWPQTQPRMAALVADLGLSGFAQHDSGQVLYLRDAEKRPERTAGQGVHGGAWRVEGGMGRLVEALLANIPTARLRPGHALTRITDAGDHVMLSFGHAEGAVSLAARRVVLAMPPRLVEEMVQFMPDLDAGLRDALAGSPTWMASRAKFVMTYDTCPWRERGESGNAFVTHEQAVLGEVFDASDREGRRGALGGFVTLSPDLRQQFHEGLPLLMANQLAQLFGAAQEGGEPLFMDWAREPFTCAARDRDAPAEALLEAGNPLLRRPALGGKLFWGGSETAAASAGHLEGALDAAERIAAALVSAEATPAASPAIAELGHSDPAERNALCLKRWQAWVAAQEDAAFDQYRHRLNRILAAQQREQVTQMALLGTMEALFAAALDELRALPIDTSGQPVQRGRSAMTPAIQAPFGRLMKVVVDNVVAFNRTSCALSNFPDEHSLAGDYMGAILRDIAAAWQEFSLSANRVLLEKAAVRQDLAARRDRATA